MITIIFVLTGILFLMLELMLQDTKILIQSIKAELYEAFDHDTKIYEDYKP